VSRHESTQFFRCGAPLRLDGGSLLPEFILAFQTYGRMSSAKDNAVLICHALSGDAHVSGCHEEDGRTGWWEMLVGPGRAIDTDRYFVICSNVLGGCKGSSGPSSPHPVDGEPWALRFPVVTIWDIVRAQERLVRHLGISRLRAVVGGSMGGMQALAWARLFPENVNSVISMATAGRHTAQNIAWNDIGRRAIMGDPRWRAGYYYGFEPPSHGQAIARMIGHVTYLSEEVMEQKFARRLRERDFHAYGFGVEFEVESYLAYQARSFNQRFDPNSYLYITRALDYFDWAQWDGSYVAAFERCRCNFLILSYTSDWLYPSARNAELAESAQIAGRFVSYHDLTTHLGHDAFLVLEEPQTSLVSQFLSDIHS